MKSNEITSKFAEYGIKCEQAQDNERVYDIKNVDETTIYHIERFRIMDSETWEFLNNKENFSWQGGWINDAKGGQPSNLCFIDVRKN